MTGLDDRELAAHTAEPLPVREQMSLMTTGGLGSGLVDVGASDTPGGTDAAGSTDPTASASAGDGYTEPAQEYGAAAQNDVAAGTPTQNDGEYSPQETATATDG